MPDFLTVTQVSAASGYSDKTIQRALDAGELRGTRHGKRGYWRIDPASAQKFLAAIGAKAPAPVSKTRRKKPSRR
jgi:hypothetical protein